MERQFEVKSEQYSHLHKANGETIWGKDLLKFKWGSWSCAGASIPLSAFSPPVSDFLPISEKFSDSIENFPNVTFSRKFFRFSSAKISDDLFLVIHHKFPPYFHYFNTFPPISTKLFFPPTFRDFPAVFGKFTCFCIVLCFLFPLLLPWCIYASHNARTGRPRSCALIKCQQNTLLLLATDVRVRALTSFDHRCKQVFSIFHLKKTKKHFKIFIFEGFLFSSALLNLLNSYIEQLLSDGLNMTVMGNSLMKSHSSQTCKCPSIIEKRLWFHQLLPHFHPIFWLPPQYFWQAYASVNQSLVMQLDE